MQTNRKTPRYRGLNCAFIDLIQRVICEKNHFLYHRNDTNPLCSWTWTGRGRPFNYSLQCPLVKHPDWAVIEDPPTSRAVILWTRIFPTPADCNRVVPEVSQWVLESSQQLGGDWLVVGRYAEKDFTDSVQMSHDTWVTENVTAIQTVKGDFNCGEYLGETGRT